MICKPLVWSLRTSILWTWPFSSGKGSNWPNTVMSMRFPTSETIGRKSACFWLQWFLGYPWETSLSYDWSIVSNVFHPNDPRSRCDAESLYPFPLRFLKCGIADLILFCVRTHRRSVPCACCQSICAWIRSLIAGSPVCSKHTGDYLSHIFKGKCYYWRPRVLCLQIAQGEMLSLTSTRFLFFFLQTAMISDEKATEFKDKVYRAITIAYAIEYLLIALGSLLIIVAIVLVILSKKKGFEVSLIDT